MVFDARKMTDLTARLLVTTALIWPSHLVANPTGAVVVGGTASVTGEGGGAVTINQQSERGIINWQDFSIGAGENVRFNQPSASSITANRVIGVNPSQILGQMSATGRVLLINPNGIVFGSDAILDSAAFVATTHDFDDNEFMTSFGDLRFDAGPDGGQIVNNGSLLIRERGLVALAAPQVINNGVVTARLGSVSLASSAGFSMDLFGDGLLSFAPGDQIATSIGDGSLPLISNDGQITADGGTIVMTAKAASTVINASVNIGGILQANSVAQSNGIIHLNASGHVATSAASSINAQNGGAVTIEAARASLGGEINVDGVDGGTVRIDVAGELSNSAAISADGIQDADIQPTSTGGSITITAERIIENDAASLSARGNDVGGVISVEAEQSLLSSGSYDVSASAGSAGRIDMTADELTLLSARFSAEGSDKGGLVRIGGAFQGGGPADPSASYYQTFAGRWGDLPDLRNASETFLNDSTVITVAAVNSDGGTAVIWSDDVTTFLGSIDARGGNDQTGGSAEISSAVLLRHASLGNVRVDGGTLLLDPKNITVGSSAEVKGWSYSAMLTGVDDSDAFGSAVALSGNARHLAIGIPGDDGSGGKTDSGAVRLYRFTGDGFAGTALAGTIGDGYTGSGNIDVANLAESDAFGTSVSLDGDGDRLAVGASGDDGRLNSVGNGGAVYLFTFSDTSFGGGALAATIGSDYTSSGDLDLTSLETRDSFGEGVSLSNDGTQLAVGAPGDDGNGNGLSDSGAAYMFNFADGSFGTPSLAGTLGDGYFSGNNLKVDTLQANDYFGTDVALDADGNRLSVGTPGDDGANDGNTDAGAVYQISFAGGDFATPSVTSQIGIGYTGSNDLAPTGLAAGDKFGAAVSLNATGDWLAVGAPDDAGASDDNSEGGAAYLFRFADADFGSPAQQSIFGKDYSSGQNVSVTLDKEYYFGTSLSLDDTATHMVVGLDGYDDTQNNEGAVMLYTGAHVSGGYGVQAVSGSYSAESTASVTVNVYDVIDMLRRSTDVELKASNDITISNKITMPSGVGSPGALRLYAGRSVAINQDITTQNGDLDVIANDLASNGVVDAQRDSGAASINVASGAAIAAGTGSVTMRIRDGSGNTNRTSGDITVGSIQAGDITLENSGYTSGTAVVIRSGTALTTSGSGDALVIKSDVFTNNGGSSALVTGVSGRFLVWSGNPTNDTRGSVSHDFKQYAATYGSTTPLGGSTDDGFLYSVDPTLSTSLTGSFIKAYDATTTFGIGAANFSVSGALDSDVVTLAASSANFASANVGSGQTVSVSGMSIASAANGAVTVYGYSAPSGTVTTNTGSITQRSLSISGSQIIDKTYDGTATASITAGTASGLQNGETLTITGSGNYASVNVGSDINVPVTYSLADGTGVASNYSLAGETLTGSINPRVLSISGSSAADKVYDGNVVASLSAGTLGNLVSGETLSVSVTGAFASANAAVGINVPVNYSLRDGSGLAANYSLADETLTATITPKALSISGSSAANKIYDGTSSAAVTAGTLGSLVGSETVSVSASGTYASVNVGSGINVTASYSLSDGSGLASNYTLANETLTSDITARALTISGSSAANKTYDGTNSATITAGTLANLVSGETLSVAGSGSFASVNVGSGINISTSYSLSDGTGTASNYTLAGETLSADITARALTISSSSVASKSYDGTNSAAITAGTLGNLVSGETLSVAGSGSFASVNVGNGINVGASYSLSDGSGAASNYTLAGETLTGNITARALTISGSAVASKTYDGTNSASITLGTLGNLVSGETVSVTGSGSFASVNAANGINVSTSYSLSDGSGAASNYSLASETLTGNITQKTLAVTGSTASDKVYDASTSASVSAGTLVGMVGSETLGLTASGTFADANVANSKYVTIAYSLADGTGLAANYSLADGGASASITKKALGVSGAAVSDKTFDGSTSATVSAGTVTGVVGSETLSITSSARFADANAGVNKNATITYSLADGTGLANNYSLSDQVVNATIAQRALSISAPTISDKTYDGGTSASVTAGTLSNLVGSDTLSVSASGSFASKNVGVGASVSVTYSLADGDGLAANYSLAAGSGTATISQKNLTMTGTTIASRAYDGSTSATISSVGTLSGVVSGDTVNVNSGAASAAFADKNAGNAKTVTLSGLTISGSDAGNYSLTSPTATGTISKKALTITSPTASSRDFDGTRNAEVSVGILSGFINTETVTATATGLFNDALAGVGKLVTVTYDLFDGTNGGLGSNYSLASQTTIADITGTDVKADQKIAKVMLETLAKAQEQISDMGNKFIEMTIAQEPKDEGESFVESMGEWQILGCDSDSTDVVCAAK